mgnify:CR=1 FL=1|tara:strand:+ start:214 stop:495 length:282 start_codon:yes stop_codon:yes gene_type:complete
MRVIETKMMAAIEEKDNFNLSNTSVHYLKDCDYSEVRLYGHLIAIKHHANDRLEVIKATLADYPTVTTKSRLRALGANVTTKKGITYLDNVAV